MPREGQEERYASAKQLAEDIRRFNAGEAIMAKPLGFFASKFRSARQHWEITLALAIMILSGIAALGYSLNEANMSGCARCPSVKKRSIAKSKTDRTS